MGNEYFDISVINFEKYILHGRIKIGVDENDVTQEKDIEQVLTEEQKKAFRKLERKQHKEFTDLMSSFVVRD